MHSSETFHTALSIEKAQETFEVLFQGELGFFIDKKEPDYLVFLPTKSSQKTWHKKALSKKFTIEAEFRSLYGRGTEVQIVITANKLLANQAFLEALAWEMIAFAKKTLAAQDMEEPVAVPNNIKANIAHFEQSLALPERKNRIRPVSRLTSVLIVATGTITLLEGLDSGHHLLTIIGTLIFSALGVRYFLAKSI